MGYFINALIVIHVLFFRFGSDYVKEEFLAPAIAGDVVTSIAVSETGGGSDVASE